MTSGGNGRRGLLLLVRRAVFVQPLDQSGPGQAHAGVPGGVGRNVRRGLQVLILTVAVIGAVDWLGAAASSRVGIPNRHWWGLSQRSPWADAAAHHMTFLSRGLTITVDGDELTAAYTVTAPAGSLAASAAESDTDSNAGNDLVDNALGDVQVGEFNYGFTGHQLEMQYLTFMPPKLQMSRDTHKHLMMKIEVDSYPFRLYRHRQQITILSPNASQVRGPLTLIDVRAPSAQTTNAVGMNIQGIANGTISARIQQATARDSKSASFIVSEGDMSPSWFGGLRAIGGITIPIADRFLGRINSIFAYCILLWAVWRARRAYPGSPLADIALRMVQVIVAASVAVAVLGLAYDISSKVIGNSPDDDYLVAGPLALLVGGTAVVWPVLCWRAGVTDSGNTRLSAAPPGSITRRPWWRVAVPVVGLLIIVALYWGRLDRLGVSVLTSIPILVGTALAAVGVPLLVRCALGRNGVLTWVTSAGLLGAVFAAATGWPLLNYSGFYANGSGPLYINLWGKWTYVTLAVIFAGGLSLLWGRTAWAAARHHKQAPRKVAAAVVTATAAVVIVAIVPDAVSESGVATPHASGLFPPDIFGLFYASDQLLFWLLLVLPMVMIMRLPSPVPWPVARDLALPMALVLLYWFDAWLYIPVTVIAGIFLIRYLMMPSELAHVTPRAGDPRTWAKNAAAGWRRAEFIAGQQQAIATSSAEKLRDSIISGTAGEFQSQLNRLADAQDDLTAKRDTFRLNARSAKIRAFSHIGAPPDLAGAAAGAIIGAVVGVIPILVITLTTDPSAPGGNYPVLGFFGGTSWNLLTWAGLGWFIGYFLPLLRGSSGAGKAMWVFITGAAATLPISLIWNDTQEWITTMVSDLELLVFLVVVTVVVCDLRLLIQAGLRPVDWVRVQNWRFVATWSAALIAAVGTIVITFATTTVTDLTQQLTQQSAGTSQQAPSTGQQSPGR